MESIVDAKKRESGKDSLKVAATYSPTTRSTIGDAVSLSAALAPLRSAVSRLCPLRSLSRARALSRAPQARTAHTPHGSLRAPQARTPPPAPRHTDEVYFPRSQPLMQHPQPTLYQPLQPSIHHLQPTLSLPTPNPQKSMVSLSIRSSVPSGLVLVSFLSTACIVLVFYLYLFYLVLFTLPCIFLACSFLAQFRL